MGAISATRNLAESIAVMINTRRGAAANSLRTRGRLHRDLSASTIGARNSTELPKRVCR